MITKLKLMAGAGAILILASGCQKKAEGQIVAVVNGEEITQQQLNAELQGRTLAPTADKKKVMAQLLQQLIDRKLLVQKAKEAGLDKSPAYLDQVSRGEDALLVDLLARKAAKGISLPDPGAVDQFISTHPTLFSARKRYKLDQISFAQPSDMAVLRQLEPAHTLDAVAATLTAAGVQFQRGEGVLDTASIAPAMADKVATLPAGEPFVVPLNGKIVVNVIKSVEPSPTPQAQAKPAATDLLRQQNLRDAMRKQLEAAKTAAKIEYQPGFGPAVAGATPAPSAP